MAGLLIWVFTADIQFTFCCDTCDVSTLVGMTMHNICIIMPPTSKKLEGHIASGLFVRLSVRPSFRPFVTLFDA